MEQQLENQTESRVQALSIEVGNIRAEMGSVVSQLQVINPGALLEFKGTVLEALKTFDKDFDNVDTELVNLRNNFFQAMDACRLEVEKKIEKIGTKADENKLEIERIKAKAAVIAAVVSFVFLILIKLFEHFILK